MSAEPTLKACCRPGRDGRGGHVDRSLGSGKPILNLHPAASEWAMYRASALPAHHLGPRRPSGMSSLRPSFDIDAKRALVSAADTTSRTGCELLIRLLLGAASRGHLLCCHHFDAAEHGPGD